MVVPGLNRWLEARYPNTICSVVEDRTRSRFVNGVPFPETTKPNPNGVEFDNLYLDMNGILHACFHPDGLPAPQSYNEIIDFIFVYIEKVFSIVRPRKLLFLSVDGVAPRAKMNQQRKRRFEAAEAAFLRRLHTQDCFENLDSNVITPGTEFMDMLSCALKYFVHVKMNRDRGWQAIKVILSDSSVVGEGEHKIMSYIRSQRNLPGYDPNTRHCLHGLDSDLIMLALATHEIHISILREVINLKHDNVGSYAVCMRRLINGLKFEFFNIWVLREYLETELLPDVEGTDFDCHLDDFVFMCYLVGNDFLPSLSSLDQSKDGFELLLSIYRREFVKMGYLTNAPEVNFKSLEHFLQVLGSQEDAMFMHWNKITGNGKRINCEESVTMHDKQNHYISKFDCESNDVDRVKRHAILKYTEGMCWIMRLYYEQLPSWQWFYPYHYAPLASDFCDLDNLEINFTLGHPFKPLDQLMSILPAESAQALPSSYRNLMTSTSSPILDFYPSGPTVDEHGKTHVARWDSTSKLPCIDESRLLSEVAKDKEKQRNRFGRDMLFVHSCHPLATMIEDLPSSDSSSEVQLQIRPDLSDGMNGDLCISDRPVFPSTISSPFVDKPALKLNQVKSVDYKCPSHAHIPRLLHGVIMPPRILRRQDRPPPPVIFYGEPESQSACPAENRQNKRRKQDGGSTYEGKQQNIIIAKPEAELVVHGTNETTVAQQLIMAGNGTEEEKQITNGICEKPFTGSESEPKTTQEKKKTKKKPNAEPQAGLVNRGGEAEGHEAKAEVPGGVTNMVNRVEEPTIGMGSSNTQQEQPVEVKRRNKMESKADAEAMANVGENPTYLHLITEEREVDPGAEAKFHEAKAEVPGGVTNMVNRVEEPTIGTGSSNTQQEQPVEVERRNKMESKADAEAVADVGENPTYLHLIIEEREVDLGAEAKFHEAKIGRIMNLVNSAEEPTIGTGPSNTQQQLGLVDLGAEAKGHGAKVGGIMNMVNSAEESPMGTWVFNSLQLEAKKRILDKTVLENGGEDENKMEPPAEAVAVANIDENLTNKMHIIIEDKKLDAQQQPVLVNPWAEAEGCEATVKVRARHRRRKIESTIGMCSPNNQRQPVLRIRMRRRMRRRSKNKKVLVNGGVGENRMESQADAEALANFGETLTNKMHPIIDGKKLDAVQQLGSVSLAPAEKGTVGDAEVVGKEEVVGDETHKGTEEKRIEAEQTDVGVEHHVGKSGENVKESEKESEVTTMDEDNVKE